VSNFITADEAREKREFYLDKKYEFIHGKIIDASNDGKKSITIERDSVGNYLELKTLLKRKGFEVKRTELHGEPLTYISW
jgi:hypothetical protein